jgi:hypothetical protein
MASVDQCYEVLAIPISACAGLVTEAGRELAAFLFAVKEVHGSHCVNIAAEHWMQALDKIHLSKVKSQESFQGAELSAASTLCL